MVIQVSTKSTIGFRSRTWRRGSIWVNEGPADSEHVGDLRKLFGRGGPAFGVVEGYYQMEMTRTGTIILHTYEAWWRYTRNTQWSWDEYLKKINAWFPGISIVYRKDYCIIY